MCDECIVTTHVPPVHQLVCLKEAVAHLVENYNQAETELHVRLELAKTLFAKRLIQSREARVEMMHLLKLVIEEIENGLPEDDSRFEKLLISIKETDRVLNNAVLCTRVIGQDEVLMYKDKDSVEGGIQRLKEQTEFINSSIKDFEQLRVARLVDIHKNEAQIKKYISQMCLNVLSYHPETFKKPK